MILDAGQREIDEKAITIIGKRQPMAIDLREVIGTIRISSDLERIGDLGKNIAKRVVAVTDTRQTLVGLSRLADDRRTGSDAAQGRARRLRDAFGRSRSTSCASATTRSMRSILRCSANS